MTLFRQLYLLLLGLFLLIVLSLSAVQFTETKKFLTEQMQSDLNNASHSLGLMLAPALEAGDDALAETLINVIFEGGHYQQISLIWMADGQQENWFYPSENKRAPQWLVNLGLFPEMTEETIITSGWLQLATLTITANPDLGYLKLWEILRNTFLLFCVLFIITLVIARIGLRHLLKPLHQLSSTAQKIAQRQFGPEIPTPKTLELRPVVHAFNGMSNQLKQIFQSLDEEVSALRKKNLVDGVSGLANRQYLMDRLNSWLAEPGNGALFLCKMDWLEQVHHKFGFQVRDDTIRQFAERLKTQLNPIANCVITRISAYEFAFLVFDVEEQVLEEYLQVLLRTINEDVTKAECKANEGFAIGIATRTANMDRAHLLGQTDNALQQAIDGKKTYHWFSQQQPLISREIWRDTIRTAIDQTQFAFKWQVVSELHQQSPLQQEIFCQLLNDKQETINASQFMPYVELFDLGAALDKSLIQKIAIQPALTQGEALLVINLSRQSIRDDSFHQWLDQHLPQLKKQQNFCFELPESAIYSSPDACEALCQVLKKHHCAFGIDHFGQQFGSMSYLQSLNPSYVKLDQAFADYNEDQHNGELCRALINVAKGLNIGVIVTGIEDQAQLENFSNLGIVGYQGYIAPPEELILTK